MKYRKMLSLNWGNALFLEPYWKNIALPSDSVLPMKYVYGGLPALKDKIISLHQQEQNANIEDKHIVIGNGATQILLALFHSLGKSVYATPPYFMRFPILADLASINWQDHHSSLRIITNPNNPDNVVSNEKGDIYDLSYNWTTYTTPLSYNEDVMVYSLSKATGHASSRIGWCLLKDATLADKLTEFIEHATAGVSIEAQTKASHVINSQLDAKHTVFEYGKDILIDRHKKLEQLTLPFEKINTSGMFLLGKMSDAQEFFNERKISVNSGESFGLSDEYFRVNLGCSNEEFKEFLKRIVAK